MKLFADNTVCNWHEHVALNDAGELDAALCDRLVTHCRLLHQDKVAVSVPINTHATPEAVSRANDAVAAAVRRHPGFLYGMAFADPHHGRAAVTEIERRVDEGFIGVKLYHQRKLDDQLQYPIVEACIKLDIPILMHAGKLSPSHAAAQPCLADSRQFKNIAMRYPETVFIMAHIGGGGDWHWQLKGRADCPNVFVDISGSVYDAGIVEETVAVFGADRVLYGADGSFSSAVGKLFGAELSDADKIIILGGPRLAKYFNRG